MQPSSRRPSALPLGKGSLSVKEAESRPLRLGDGPRPHAHASPSPVPAAGRHVQHGTGLLHVFTCTGNHHPALRHGSVAALNHQPLAGSEALLALRGRLRRAARPRAATGEANAVAGRARREKRLSDKGVNLLLQVALPARVLQAPYRRGESSSWLRSPQAYRVLAARRAPPRQHPLTAPRSHPSPSHPCSPLGSARRWQPEELLPQADKARHAQPCTREPSAQHRGTSVASRPLRQPHTRLCRTQGAGFVTPSLPDSR